MAFPKSVEDTIIKHSRLRDYVKNRADGMFKLVKDKYSIYSKHCRYNHRRYDENIKIASNGIYDIYSKINTVSNCELITLTHELIMACSMFISNYIWYRVDSIYGRKLLNAGNYIYRLLQLDEYVINILPDINNTKFTLALTNVNRQIDNRELLEKLNELHLKIKSEKDIIENNIKSVKSRLNNIKIEPEETNNAVYYIRNWEECIKRKYNYSINLIDYEKNLKPILKLIKLEEEWVDNNILFLVRDVEIPTITINIDINLDELYTN